MKEEEARFMKTKLHLKQKEIRDLIVAGLKARDFRTTGGVHVAFVTEQDGTIAALVENMRERTEEESPEEESPEEESGEARAWVAKVQREEESNIAADILGGDGGVLGTGDALSEGVGGGRPAAAARKKAKRRPRRTS